MRMRRIPSRIHTAIELHPDALHFRHRQRADLLPGADGQKSSARMVCLGRNDGFVPAGVFLCCHCRSGGQVLSISNWGAASGGNMEGKEVRFGIFNSALCCHRHGRCFVRRGQLDARFVHALGGFVPLFNIQLGEIIIGGVGAGLYGMLVFVVLAVFIAG